jgi:hypothetical protein
MLDAGDGERLKDKGVLSKLLRIRMLEIYLLH